MLHAATPPRRHDRARAAVPLLPPLSRAATPTCRLSSLDLVAVQIITGFISPLPFIQLGHWCFGWTSVTVMFGGQ
ncbi:hypothetical protein K7957_05880 [Sphingomonas yunnanensis]|uniref:hypothetical protein n=1 Tax=Sphingomonas yunnanensis TaxID=310400 RepID=UPI001CA6EAA9|nr:hypothetical protein [Sphingomonas yunnanensis]MBY9062459.1 hypothetical protein [Sphingomonas yunnanensis]